MDSSAWAVTDHAMHPPTEDEFQQFLDMNNISAMGDGINYDFNEFHHSTANQQLDTPMSGTDAPMLLSRVDPALQQQMPPITTTSPYQAIPTTMMSATTMIPPPTPTEAIVDSIDAQIQFLQRQKLEHQQRQLDEQRAAFFAYQQNHMVPPTPQSLEIQAANAHFYSGPHQPEHHDQQQRQQAVEYRYPRLKDRQDMSFTPLVSPAVTPLETHFPVDTQFTVPGAYFSPLTSPAIHAQNDTLAAFDHGIGAMSSSSPREMDLEAAPVPLPSPAPGDLAKKVRKNATKARGKPGVKQSPISKPLRRKTATTPSLNAQVLNELVESAEQNRDLQQAKSSSQVQTSSSSTNGTTDSENGSVSPEALTDMAPLEMPPPPIPKPKSARPSPYIAPQQSAPSNLLQAVRSKVPSPATPASLMKLSSPNNRNAATRAGSQEPMDTDHIETFELPESASFSKPGPARINTSVSPQIIQQDNTSKTPNLKPLPSPAVVSAVPVSASQSPLLTPNLASATRKTPLLAARGSKKRGSVSSVHVSPALRPKISPNIKPLLPGGTSVEDAASQLLASKSNYQRILEGSMVPGVTYPSELSTNLSSKRTSHKIAEQGRRNRINSALQEIATLLPRPPQKEGKDLPEPDSSGGGDGKDKGGAAPNSKASTVELAIDYIKQLQKEVAEANRRAEEAEKKLGLKETEAGDS
ncbi:Helix-loop-helix DNA-binding domain containing protein [Rhypophila decipiens]